MLKNKRKKYLKYIPISLFFLFMLMLFFPTFTPKISGVNSVSELRKVKINGTGIEIMIRGKDKSNPIILFVHGGPCCSEIPYIRKYQDLLEKEFTVVHYDQRGSGKSYQFFQDYSKVTASDHTNDLIALTKYVENYLGQKQVILTAHSYGTYFAIAAAQAAPELYRAYVGIGQMSNTSESELDGLHRCIRAAKASKNIEDVTALEEMEDNISRGKTFVPREYIRKYGFAARMIDEDADYRSGFLFGTEYNIADALGFHTAAGKYQEGLIMETLANPISDIVKTVEIPVYFVMGEYDGMTSPEAAGEYLNKLAGNPIRQIRIIKNCAHYPHLEQKEAFYQFMYGTFWQKSK